MRPTALTIAGSDPSGGAGLQADLKTFHQHGVYGTSVVTLLTAQNTQRVEAVEVVASELVVRQFDAVTNDVPPLATKSGALGNAKIIEAVASCVRRLDCPIVVDPVMVSKHGQVLIEDHAVDVLRDELISIAYLVTPNRHEAARLSGISVNDSVSMREAAKRIEQLGAKNVLIKGGKQGGVALDVLLSDGEFRNLEAAHVETRNTHGSGCVLSASITSGLAHELDLVTAVRNAKDFVTRGIRHAEGIGHGRGPLNLYVDVNSPKPQ
jgi:hydroxymethylpyrimidine/phosphomethylpyrimidine kinase